MKMIKKTNADSSILSLCIMIAIVLVGMAILKPGTFYTMTNLRSMIFQFPEFGIMALGMMLCMISGGIDLSLVGIANLSGIVATYIMLAMGGSTVSIAIACVAAILVGALCGCFNGFMIGYLKIPAMLVTLCGLQLYGGIGLGITTGPALTGLPDAYKYIANGSIGNIPVVVFIFIVVVALVGFLMNFTVYGQQVRFMGSNDEASRYSGINNLKVTIMTYMISGILGAISGILITSHFNSAKADYGSSYTLLTLLIVVLGGVHPDGGRGKVSGVVLSILLLQLVAQAFSILQIDPTGNMKTFVYGLLLILVLCSETFKSIKKKKVRKTEKSQS